MLYDKAHERFDSDGLNSIEYKLVSTLQTPLYTKFLVSYDEEAILQKHHILTTRSATTRLKKTKNHAKSVESKTKKIS